MRRLIGSFLLCLLYLGVLAQSNDEQVVVRKSQLIIRLDNDAFISGRKDRYYSAGHFLDYYQYLGDGKSYSLGFGNLILTPDLPAELPPSEIDRPFAGLNYLKFGFQKRKQNWFYEASLLTGIIGPKSGVGQFHDWYHDLANFPRAMGWENQIEDSFIINLESTVIRSIWGNGNFEILGEANAALGNLEQSLSIKPSFRIGTFQPLAYSQINGSRVGTRSRQEQFFQFGAELKRVFFNRTIDGDLISPEIPPSFESKDYIGELFGEFILNYNHFGMGYGIYYRTKENESARDQVFARITLSWLF
ncbi:lipid A-modifier LpxR family protein [Algoriphagus namhaensis]|uniref:Lipid A-modifier LpxR family protein n=1 Tax=Algoriphagus namhaensis TaxID=915353 RepID=A0ABV8AMQ5_9BACT